MLSFSDLDFLAINKCMLCHEAPCGKVCPKGVEVDRVLRSMYFSNWYGAAEQLKNISCQGCEAPCEVACVLQKVGERVEIRKILSLWRQSGAGQMGFRQSILYIALPA